MPNSTTTAPFKLAARYKGKQIFIYEFRHGFKTFYSCSVQGRLIATLEVTPYDAIKSAKDMIDFMAGQTSSLAKNEERQRRLQEKLGDKE